MLSRLRVKDGPQVASMDEPAFTVDVTLRIDADKQDTCKTSCETLLKERGYIERIDGVEAKQQFRQG